MAVVSDGPLEENDTIKKYMRKIMAFKMNHLKLNIKDGQKEKLFSNAIPLEDLMSIIIGLVIFKIYNCRVANFQYDIIKSGDKMIKAILKLIKA